MAFSVFVVIFLLFWAAYLLFGVALVYHVRQYTLPGHPLPSILTGAFSILSTVFFLASLFFLAGLYRALS